MNIEPLPDYVQRGFDKLQRDLRFIIECFGEVLEELGLKELAAVLPWSSEPPPADASALPERVDQAYSIAFQLLNMVEDTASAYVRAAREASEGLSAERGLWGQELKRLKEAGFRQEKIAEALSAIRVEPVLTAHPTEAKRLAVLEQHRMLHELLERRENQALSPSEQRQLRDEIKATLERLWRTGEILLTRPQVADERRNMTHYLRDIFPAVLPRLDERLRHAWSAAGFDAHAIDDPARLPQLRFGTWVGGDRDGHPFVTAEVTGETLERLRLNALVVLHRHISALGEKLSLSSWVQSPPDALKSGILRLGAQAIDEEPWRQFANLMLGRLPLEMASGAMPSIRENSGSYTSYHELLVDLQLLHDSLGTVGANRLARMDVVPVIRAACTFGFHLAQLDVRQNSQAHDRAIAELMSAVGLDGADYMEWSEADRLRFAEKELRSPRPFLHAHAPLGADAMPVVSCYRVLAKHIARHGREGIGALIVSMTRDLSDLLNVYLLAREAGLTEYASRGLTLPLPVVPLFETLGDLERSPAILKKFLEHPVTRRSLEAQVAHGAPLVQQVMIGYSDSNKDAGILASQWGLHRAQELMAQVGCDCGVLIRFFHGRGGTTSRGAGPTHRFLEALPHGSLSGDIRLTEQGETVAQKFSNVQTATYNLDLLVAGVTATTLLHKERPQGNHPLEPIAARLAKSSHAAYRALIESEGFLAFFREATAIDVLESSRIGSRPSRRTGEAGIADLRAIPWVFGWTQSRFYLPGWFGVGSALHDLEQSDAGDFARLVHGVEGWPFLRYVLTNVETAIASTDIELMRGYAGLVQDESVRERILGIITGEWERTVRMLDKIRGAPVEARRPRMTTTLKLRADALRVLHLKQINVLRRWRGLRQEGKYDEADRILPELLLTVNAIASGLRTTG